MRCCFYFQASEEILYLVPRPGHCWSTMQSYIVLLKTSHVTWHHGCSMVKGFVMTSFKTSVVHRAQFSIVLQWQEHAKSLTNTLYSAQNTWQSFSDCDVKGKTEQKYVTEMPSWEHLEGFASVMSISTAQTSISASDATWLLVSNSGSLNWLVSRVHYKPLDPPRSINRKH